MAYTTASLLLLCTATFVAGQNASNINTLSVPNSGDPVAGAKPGEVRLMFTGSVEGPIEVIRDRLEEEVGRHLVIQYGSARGNLKREILAGQAFEVTILLSDVTDELDRKGKVKNVIEIARVKAALGQIGNVPPRDVSTPDALKQTILGAKSLRWYPTGVAITTVNKILDTLDIREAAMKHYHAPGVEAEIGPGEYEIVIYPLSEILILEDVHNLGIVIPAFQVPSVITAAISTNTWDATSAEIVMEFLMGPEMEATLIEHGMSR